MAQVFGIVGLAGAGKDTAAEAMQLAFVAAGVTARIGSFAAPIRSISKLMGLEPYDRKLKEKRKDFAFSEFDVLLFDAIEDVLGSILSDNDRALLYTFTIDSLDAFTYDDCGETRISISPREFMQYLGTEGGQRVRRLLWVEIAATFWRQDPGVVLCTDCRFDHELDVIDRLLVVTRPGTVRINQHASEDLAERATNGAIPAPHKATALRLLNDSTQERFEEFCSNVAAALAKGIV